MSGSASVFGRVGKKNQLSLISILLAWAQIYEMPAMIFVNKTISLLFKREIDTYLLPITPSTCKKLRIGYAAFSLAPLCYFCRLKKSYGNCFPHTGGCCRRNKEVVRHRT